MAERDSLREYFVTEVGSGELVRSDFLITYLGASDTEARNKGSDKLLPVSETWWNIANYSPDLESIARNYLTGIDEGDVEASGKYMIKLWITVPETATALESKMRCIFGHSQHKWMYDRYSLLSLLKERGFSEIRIAGFGDWSDERFSEVEEEGRHYHAICTESRKPRISGLVNESAR